MTDKKNQRGKPLDLGWAKPDDPIFKTGFVIGEQRTTPSRPLTPANSPPFIPGESSVLSANYKETDVPVIQPAEDSNQDRESATDGDDSEK